MDQHLAQKLDWVTRQRAIVNKLTVIRAEIAEQKHQLDSQDYYNTITTQDMAGTAHDGLTQGNLQASVAGLEAIAAEITAQQDAIYPIVGG